uniref:Transcription factor IIIA n=1 Tax=Esox lucius TaxID=8010 RepID=A0A3P8YBR3_ESOLU
MTVLKPTISPRKATFNKSWKLDAHLCKHTGLKPFSCKNCDKRFCTRYELTRHELSHSGERPYKCQAEGCAADFVTHASMKNHMIQVHQLQEKHYKCDHEVCGKEFRKKSKLKTHKMEHKQLLPFQCDIEDCKKQFAAPGQLKRHGKVHQGYPCAVEDCPFQGKTWSEYQKHRKAVHRVKLQCDSCSRVFLEAWFLKQHQLRIHSDVPKKVFQCSDAECRKTFTKRFNLENHQLSEHEGKKAFCCAHEGCGKSFAMQESLRRHQVVHDPLKKKLQKSHPKKGKSSQRKTKTESGTASTQAETSELAARLRNTSLNDSTP